MELKIRDKKFTYIVVVDFGLVKSTRKKRSGRKKVDKNEVVDNRKTLMEMSSKAKTSFSENGRDKNVIVDGKLDKKKRKRENLVQQDYQKEDGSVPKRKKIFRTEDNLKETELWRSSQSSSLDKNMRGDKKD